jgi:hypothetical protein
MTVLVTHHIKTTLSTILKNSRYSGVIKVNADRERGTVELTMKPNPAKPPLNHWGVRLTNVIELEVGRD